MTVKVPEGAPEPDLIEQAPFCTGVPDMEHVVSVGRNPVPLTITWIPTAPEAGLRVTEGPEVSTNVADAKSPVLPVSRTTYDPTATLPTLKVPLATPVPVLMLHAGFLVKEPDVGLDMVQVLSVKGNPVPFTMTRTPITPEPGLRVIDGLSTVNVAFTESPVLPVTVIV